MATHLPPIVTAVGFTASWSRQEFCCGSAPELPVFRKLPAKTTNNVACFIALDQHGKCHSAGTHPAGSIHETRRQEIEAVGDEQSWDSRYQSGKGRSPGIDRNCRK